MYCPPHFAVQDEATLLGLMRDYPLASVVYSTADGPQAEHLPLHYLDGKLQGHCARRNPLAQMPGGSRCLLIFQGPQAYISPNGYASKAVDGRVVPTWNYAVVQVQARLTTFDDATRLLGLLEHSTRTEESAETHPWQVGDAPQDFTRTLAAHITGLEFRIESLQGKWKISQNQSHANQQSLMTRLESSGKPTDNILAALMRQHLPAENG